MTKIESDRLSELEHRLSLLEGLFRLRADPRALNIPQPNETGRLNAIGWSLAPPHADDGSGAVVGDL